MSVLRDAEAALAGRSEEFRSVCIEELSRVLRLNPAEFDDSRNFDEYGLDSIDALVALGAISDQLGVDLPPELLFVHRTLGAAVKAITGVREPSDDNHERAHSFWFPGGGILDEPLVINFRSRLSDLPAFETIHVGSWFDWHQRGRSIDDLATAALAQIESAAPEGPFLFAGDSQGGQLAYVTALAALAAGREVAGVILFDTAADYPISSTSLPVALARAFTDGVALIRATDRRSSGDYMAFLAWHVVQLSLAIMSPGRLLSFAARLRSRLFSDPRIDRRLQTLAFGKLWEEWPKSRRFPLDTSVVLLRSADEPGAEDLGWGQTLPRLTIAHVPGGHRTMFDHVHAPVLREAFMKSVSVIMDRQN